MVCGGKVDRHDVGVFIHRGVGNLVHAQAHTEVDHFHAGIAQGTRHDLDAAVMTVEPGLARDDADATAG